MLKRRAVAVCAVAAGMAAIGVLPVAGVAHAAAVSGAITVGDLNVVEGDLGTTTVRVPITLKTPAVAPVSIKYAIVGATAVNKSDFKAPKKGKATFNVGEFAKWVSVNVIGDGLVEGNETLNFVVTRATGAPVADGTGVVTLTDNDANGVATTPEVTAGRPTVWEGNVGERESLVPIRLSCPSYGAVTVAFSDGCGERNVRFAPGQIAANVSVAIGANFSAQPTYTIPNTIRVASGSASAATPSTAVTVRDDDGLGSSQAVGSTLRASETSLGREAKYPTWACDSVPGRSRGPSISANGRYVAFESNAWNLVANDTNGETDVFVKDMWTGIIERVSVSSGGAQANNESVYPTISPDGRFVLFGSYASNLVPGDLSWWSDVFIHDRTTHTTSLIAPYSDNGMSSLDASISADNRYVAFLSELDLGGDTDAGEVCPTLPGGCGKWDIFVLDRTTGAYTAVTSGENGAEPTGRNPVISANGASVAFNGNPDQSATIMFGHAFVSDWQAGVTDVVSVNSAEQPMQGWGTPPVRPAISANGRQVSFVAEACNLGAPCLIGPWPDYRTNMQVYTRDRNAGTTTVDSMNGPSPTAITSLVWSVALSANGRFVTFATDDRPVIPGWTSKCFKEVVQKDRLTGARVRVSSSRFGGCPTGTTDSYPEGISGSADGSFVAFDSDAKDIVPRDGQTDADIFVTRLR